jgi:hypothetical protein
MRQEICVVGTGRNPPENIRIKNAPVILENKISCSLTFVCASSFRPSQHFIYLRIFINFVFMHGLMCIICRGKWSPSVACGVVVGTTYQITCTYKLVMMKHKYYKMCAFLGKSIRTKREFYSKSRWWAFTFKLF